MKKRFYALCTVCLVICGILSSCNEGPYRIQDGVIVFPEPSRAPGQTDMLSFAASPLDTVRVGFIGLGMRGPSAVYRFSYIDGARVAALCDLEPDSFGERSSSCVQIQR